MDEVMDQDNPPAVNSTIDLSSNPMSSHSLLSHPPSSQPLSSLPPSQTSIDSLPQSLSSSSRTLYKVPRKNDQSVRKNPPRIRAYPNGSARPWVVFFRPKGKPLNILQISRDLVKRFSAVSDITKVRPNRLRVSVGSLKQANEIAACELFTREYHVYVPSREVEIDGVVSESSLTCEDLMQYGIGRFKDPMLQPVKILECKQLYSVSVAGGKKTYSPSGSFRVTFAGSALPSHVVIDKVRLPVRLFIPRVMNCLNCKQLGHTASHCCSKARCGKCGEHHADNTCSKDAEKCVYCGEAPHELSACPVYKQRGDKMKRSIKERSKRSYAEMLKATATNPLTDDNPFGPLSTDEIDSDDSSFESSFVITEDSRKRKNRSSSRIRRKERKVFKAGKPDLPNKAGGNADKKPKPTAPGLANLRSDREFPDLPGTSKSSPRVPLSKPEVQSDAGLLQLSDIMEWIFKAFKVPEHLKNILTVFLPAVKTFLKQQAA